MEYKECWYKTNFLDVLLNVCATPGFTLASITRTYGSAAVETPAPGPPAYVWSPWPRDAMLVSCFFVHAWIFSITFKNLCIRRILTDKGKHLRVNFITTLPVTCSKYRSELRRLHTLTQLVRTLSARCRSARKTWISSRYRIFLCLEIFAREYFIDYLVLFY